MLSALVFFALFPGAHKDPARYEPPSAPPSEKRSGKCEQLHRKICQKRGVTRDPTGDLRPDMEGELDALRLYKAIAHEHPNWSRQQSDEELVRRIYTPKRRARMESAHRWTLQALLRWVDRQPSSVFTIPQKRVIRQRLRAVRLELPRRAADYADEPELFTKNDVFYERTDHGGIRLRVGGAFLLASRSWFNVIFTMAHELAHALDPCELRQLGLKLPAYERLAECFLRSGMIDNPPERVECGTNDQLSESFADWLAVTITADALRVFATEFHGPQLMEAATNAVRDLCEPEESSMESDMSEHPSPQTRIEKIFGGNPRIRDVLGCGVPEGRDSYCSLTRP